MAETPTSEEQTIFEVRKFGKVQSSMRFGASGELLAHDGKTTRVVKFHEACRILASMHKQYHENERLDSGANMAAEAKWFQMVADFVTKETSRGQNGSRLAESKPRLEEILVLNETVDPYTGDGLYRDEHGQFYRARVESPQDAKPVTAEEALRWYVQNWEDSRDGHGSIVPVISDALDSDRGLVRLRMNRDEELSAGAEARLRKKTKATIEIGCFEYGLFQAAAVVNECTIQQAIEAFINEGDRLNAWHNSGFPIE